MASPLSVLKFPFALRGGGMGDNCSILFCPKTVAGDKTRDYGWGESVIKIMISRKVWTLGPVSRKSR